ncbi:PIN domain-containing protein [Methylobacterium sp. SyP6R]|uniref:PIN domain-containing protein n=1 Tax=Methylobacterium sp. SyP6R TaxID=2718876 RepID=UPI003FA5A4B8
MIRYDRPARSARHGHHLRSGPPPSGTVARKIGQVGSRGIAARALHDRIAIAKCSRFLILPHFLRRTGIHFVGKCSIIISVAELHYGCATRGSVRLLRQVEAVLEAIDVVPFEPPADVIYGRIRAELETAARPIGTNDLLIAAQALALAVPPISPPTRRSFGGSAG